MKFFNFGKKKKSSPKSEYYFGLVLSQDEGTGLLIKQTDSKQGILIEETRKFHYSNGWENLVYDIDEILFAIEDEKDIKIDKVFYFIYAHFVDFDSKQIKETYADSLKNISKENSLEPVGYFEFNELIPSYLQNSEDSKLNAVIIEVDSPAVTVFIYKAGNLVASKSAAKTENVAEDVEQLLTDIKTDDVLPTRIILYDTSNMEEESNALLTHKWAKNLFVQIPKVEVLSDGNMLEIVTYGIEKQLFKNVPTDVQSTADFSDFEEEKDKDLRDKLEPDIDEVDKNEESETKKESETKESQSDEVVSIPGFVIGKDIQMNDGVMPSLTEEENIASPEAKKKKKLAVPSIKIPTIPSFSSFGSKKLTIPITIVTVLLLVGGLVFSMFYFFHTATITILYQPEEVSEEVEISDLTIEEKVESFQESASVAASGTKSIGEKAEGAVTIYNAQEQEQSLGEGTTFTAANDLEFVLSGSVTAEAGTTKITSEGDILTTTSKTDAKLIASAIGPSYNIRKDTEFTIEGNDKKDIFAKATDNFTGGSEEEVKVVSESDYKNVNDAINEKLDKRAADAAKKEGNISIVSELTEINVEEENYSHDIDDEADSLDLSVDAKVTFFSYSEVDMRKKLVSALEEANDKEILIKDENVTYTIDDVEADSDNEDVILIVDAKAESSFSEEPEKVIQDIVGKDKAGLRGILRDQYKAAGYEMTVDSPLPFLQNILPFFAKNIEITFEPIHGKS